MAKKLTVGDDAPNLTLINSAGERVSLSDIWTSKPTVITFLRHFG